MTALGSVVIWRIYFSCQVCRMGGYLADGRLGLEGFLTRGATRLICLLGGRVSFAEAERLLKECCGWTISDERIRQACQAEAKQIAEFRAESPAVPAAFAAAQGNVEFEERRQRLLSDGWAGLCNHIGTTLGMIPELAGHAALGELTGYFAKHTERLNYSHRLYTGQSIGSEMIEGAAKNLVGRRLKQTGAHWKVLNADLMAELCCLAYGDHRELYWASFN